MEYYSALKVGNHTICDNLGEPRGHYLSEMSQL